MSLDHEIDALFAVAPEGFTADRDRLAKTLAAAGDKDGAAEVKRLRKPTLVAWSLNQLSRRHPKDLKALVESGQALRTAQRRAASGAKESGFQEATEKRRSAVKGLTAKGLEILSEAGKPSQAAESEIGRTLEAASVDPEAGDQLLRGRLSKPISTVPGFDSVGGFEVISGSAGESDDTNAAQRSASRAAIRNAERQAHKADADAQRARMRADTLEQEAQQLRRRADAAAEEAVQLEGLADEARKKLERTEHETGS